MGLQPCLEPLLCLHRFTFDLASRSAWMGMLRPSLGHQRKWEPHFAKSIGRSCDPWKDHVIKCSMVKASLYTHCSKRTMEILCWIIQFGPPIWATSLSSAHADSISKMRYRRNQRYQPVIQNQLLGLKLIGPRGFGITVNEMAQWFRASTMIGSSHLMIDAASKGIPCCLYKRSRQGPVLGSEDSETTDSKLLHFTKVNSRLVAKAYWLSGSRLMSTPFRNCVTGRRGFPLNPFIFCICHQQRPRGWKRTPLDTAHKYADALHQAGAQDDLFIPWYCTYDGPWWSLFWLGLV